jgi:hypothetical protein
MLMNPNTEGSRRAQGRRAALAVAALGVSVFLTGFSLNPFASSPPPALMVLLHAEGGKLIETKIGTKSGASLSPDKNKPQKQWVIRAGDTLKSNARPADRVVKFYKGTGSEGILIFMIKVRYFPDEKGGWVPKFQLDQEPLVVYENGRWRPLSTIQGVPNLIVQNGSTLPNAEGYFALLQFGFSTGPTSIDAWVVY